MRTVTLARKPHDSALGAVAAYGTGALNAEGCLCRGRYPANVLLQHSHACVRRGTKVIKVVGATARDKGATGSGVTFVSGKPHGGFREKEGERVENWRCFEACPVWSLGEHDARYFHQFAGSDGNPK